MSRRVCGSLALAMGLFMPLVLCGCPGNIWDDTDRGPVASISPKSMWRAYGDFQNPQYAVDGNIDTYAITGTSYEGARLTIDLGRRCLFNMIILDPGPGHEMDYCRRIAVQISYDGVNYRQIYSAPGTRGLTYCDMVTPTVARYIRLVATVPGDRPWAIAEVYLK